MPDLRGMVRISEPGQEGRLFRICRPCGDRQAYFWRRNLFGRGWPDGVFDEAVEKGFVTSDDQVVE